MKILFITQVWPKFNSHNMYSDLMQEFSERKHEVTVIALNEKRNNQKTYLSNENNINVLRVRCGNIQKTNKYVKVISSVLAGIQIEIAANKYLKNQTFDLLILALSTTLIVPSVLRLKKKYDAKFYLLLKEFWPQDLVDLGALKKGSLLWKIFRNLEKRLYSGADYIGTMSEAGIRYINDNNTGLEKKLEVCPNSQKPKFFNTINRNYIRKKYEIPQDKCIFVFGGNLGLSQGIQEMINSIKYVRDRSDIFFLIIGDGTEFNRIKNEFREEKEDFIDVRHSIPQQDFEELISACDVGLLFLFKDYTVPNVPSRLVSYLLAELPVMAAVDKATDVGDIIENYGCGIKLYNGDYERFKYAVASLKDEKIRANMKFNSKKLMLEKYTTEKCYETIMGHF